MDRAGGGQEIFKTLIFDAIEGEGKDGEEEELLTGEYQSWPPRKETTNGEEITFFFL